jgi:hypothetical protein
MNREVYLEVLVPRTLFAKAAAELNKQGFARRLTTAVLMSVETQMLCADPDQPSAYVCIFEHPSLLSLHARRATSWERFVINGQFAGRGLFNLDVKQAG